MQLIFVDRPRCFASTGQLLGTLAVVPECYCLKSAQATHVVNNLYLLL